MGVGISTGRRGSELVSPDRECRIQTHEKLIRNGTKFNDNLVYGKGLGCGVQENPPGRYPPNVLLQHHEECKEECHEDCVVRMLGEQSGKSKGKRGMMPGCYGPTPGRHKGWVRPCHVNYLPREGGYDDEGTAARFFPQFKYCPKASRSERNKGCDGLQLKRGGAETFDSRDRDGTGEYRKPLHQNTHPCVKPIAVLEWLIKLVCPEGGTVLDPFMGSGSTGVACAKLNRKFVGIDVWVFTTLEEVVFMYRPTREGNFLQKLLRDFHGVLVSDFYSAYDSINCPQQKCLIHLIRDMNQELLNNPYDEELQSITLPFGDLLRAVVETVDKHGLKRRYLQRHRQDVQGFFHGMSVKTFHSEVAELLRNRLMRNRDKVFTFINHDGIPWNNNNAENASKQFAYYRENAGSRLTEIGLTDFLVLLSIRQTCRYKGISFLRFMLSRERDLDAFSDSKRIGRCPPAIQIYPKGFTPPNLMKRHDQKLPRQPDKLENEVQDTQ